MSIFILLVAAFFGSILTFLAGFGLGTILLPVFTLFFPLPIAITANAVVHLSNNLFKSALVWKHIHFPTFLRFGITAIGAAILGGWCLDVLQENSHSIYFKCVGYGFTTSPLKSTIGILMLFFALFELIPALKNWKVNEKWLPIGGLLAGFFGGLSGHQGAFRSTFLTKGTLTKEQFIATGTAIAVVIDIARLSFYAFTINFYFLTEKPGSYLVPLAIFAALVGSLVGNRLLKKTTFKSIQLIVGIALITLAFVVAFG